ncbi:MAG: alpha/beta hydrolase [Deltaproteobacteria bacterium]|nr:alpha/beta hydrolase [Deltaproteobacteria bacterium]
MHAVELGAGDPVVMLHGLVVGNLASWYFTAAPALAERHRVLLYDLRGHGRSERPRAGYDLETMTDDLEQVLAERGAAGGPVTLVGHSYGALVALRFAERHPERVERLALVEAPLLPGHADDLLGFLKLPEDSMIDALPADLRGALAQGGRRARRLLDGLLGLALETTLLADLAATRPPPDEALAGLTCPVMAVYGTASACLPGAHRVRALLPHARVEQLAGGHYLPLEKPAELSALLVDFTCAPPGATHG